VQQPSEPMNASDPAGSFSQLTHFGGFDWAKDHHNLAVVDSAGEVLLELEFPDTAEGWAKLREKIQPYPRLGVAIETSSGPAVERLLDLGLRVFPLNPKAAERYRDRKAPSGVKSDPLDGWAFADALRTDGRDWRELRPQDPLTTELRLLCRDEIHLIEQRTALVHQFGAALHEYYPAALEAFDDLTSSSAWEFVLAFPTPAALAAAGKRKWEKFFHVHKLYRPEMAEKRIDIFSRATQFASPNPAVIRAKSVLACALARQLRTLETELEKYRRLITELFNQHPDHDCFGSLPGAGEKIAPRLLAELGSDRRVFDSPQALQCYAGTAPVTRKSGKQRFTFLRRGCNKLLRSTVHLWANLSRANCVWAEVYYQHKKAQGLSHAAALRCLGQRWLKILWKMWQENRAYNETKHLKNQLAHGSWVVALMPDKAETLSK